jgi:transposase
VLVVLCAYRLIAPGSEWRLHREWFERSAMADLLAEDYALAAKDTLYRALDRLLAHKEALFQFLKDRWQDLFGVTFDVLLYDLTSTYFESDPPFPKGDLRRHGYSRDHRPDCVQGVIALIVMPEGFPLAYEVLPGNTADKTTLRPFLKRIEQRYGKARRIWVMDRGIPTEEVLAQIRAADPPVHYVVGTPKGRLTQLEAALTQRPWQSARESVQVKLLPQAGELYVLVQSAARVNKARAMRRRKLKKLWQRLKTLQAQRPSYERLLLELGAAKKAAGRVSSLVRVDWPEPPPAQTRSRRVNLTFGLKKDALQRVRRREGRYLLRFNLTETDPGRLWEFYLQLVEIEAAFKHLKGDLSVRPIFHQRRDRIEAHLLVSFLAYCLQVSLREKLRRKAPGLTPRSVLEKFGALAMQDVHFPTTDGRELVFARYTQPDEQELLLAQLGLRLPAQSPPRITAKREVDL